MKAKELAVCVLTHDRLEHLKNTTNSVLKFFLVFQKFLTLSISGSRNHSGKKL